MEITVNKERILLRIFTHKSAVNLAFDLNLWMESHRGNVIDKVEWGMIGEDHVAVMFYWEEEK